MSDELHESAIDWRNLSKEWGKTMDETKDAVIEWMANGEVGSSSYAMAFWLAFGKMPKNAWHSYPHDPNDFDRCLKLLQRAPALRARLHMMRGVSAQWAAIVDNWDEIEASQLDEIGIGWCKAKRAPKTYAIMQNILSLECHGTTTEKVTTNGA